jgi:hypothetical protein
MTDPAILAEAAECLRRDIAHHAVAEVTNFLRENDSRPGPEFIEQLLSWGFDPEEWMTMPADERQAILTIAARNQRNQRQSTNYTPSTN